MMQWSELLVPTTVAWVRFSNSVFNDTIYLYFYRYSYESNSQKKKNPSNSLMSWPSFQAGN